MRSRSVLSRAVVMMSRAFAMEKRCVRPRSQLLLESRLLGQIHMAGHCHSEQKWCLVLCLFQSRFWAISSDRTNSDDARAYKQQGHFPSGEECQSMSTLVLGRRSFFWGQEVECLMVSSFCSSSGVPIQFQPLWALFCFKLIFCLLFD